MLHFRSERVQVYFDTAGKNVVKEDHSTSSFIRMV